MAIVVCTFPESTGIGIFEHREANNSRSSVQHKGLDGLTGSNSTEALGAYDFTTASAFPGHHIRFYYGFLLLHLPSLTFL